jgi:hypothetical protein
MPQLTLCTLGLYPLAILLCLQLRDPNTLKIFAPSWITDLVTPGSAASRGSTPIIMTSTPAFGHREKVNAIAEDLNKLGYPVTLITGWEFEDHIKKAELEFEPLDGTGKEIISGKDMAEFFSLKRLDQELFAIKNVFLKVIPDSRRTVQRIFTKFRKEYGHNQPLVFVYDSSF